MDDAVHDLYPAPPEPVFDIQVFLNDRTSPDLLRIALELAVSQRAIASLVWRPDRSLTPESNASLMRILKPHQIGEAETDAWHGTRLLDSKEKTIVRQFTVTPEVATLFLRIGDFRLFIDPHYPEDLAFANPNREMWMYTTTHENFCAISTERLEKPSIRKFKQCIVLPRKP